MVFAFACSIASCAHADIYNAIGSLFKEKTPFEQSGFGLEVLNKSGSPIWVAVIQSEGLGGIDWKLEGPFQVLPKGLFEYGNRAFKVGINTKRGLALWKNNPGTVDASKTITAKGTWTITPKPDTYVEFGDKAKGKTAYVTYDKNGIRPQTGPRGGKAGMTDSGLSLEKNVNQADITPIK